MTLEDVSAIETLLGSRARSRAESAHHVALVMGQGMSILIVLAGKALLVVVACHNRTFFRPFRLMGKHVRLQVLEQPATVNVWTTAPFPTIFVESNAGRSWAVLRIA